MMKLKDTGLILGLALLLCACEDPGTIGIDVDKTNLDFNVAYKQFNLPASLVQIDSVPTSNTQRIIAGRYDDPKFGMIQSIGYSQLFLSGAVTIDPDATYDSLVLKLKLDYAHGTDIKSPQTLNIHRLEEDINDIATYYSYNTFDYSETPIGGDTFYYQFEDDETIDYDSTLRIPMSDNLGLELFGKLLDEDDTTFNSIGNWIDYFKGIVLIAGDEYQTTTGFDVNDEESEMVLYYHFPNFDGIDVFTSLNFPTRNGASTSSFEYDRSGTAISSVIDFKTEYDASDGIIYMQSGTGLMVKIDFTEFINFSDTIQNMIINRGDLTLGEVDPYTSYIVPPNSLVYYITDSTNQRLRSEEGVFRAIQQDSPLVDAAGVSAPLEAKFNEDIRGYSDPISGHLQALYNGLIPESSVLTYPNFVNLITTFDQFSLDPENITLEVYYSTADSASDPN
jgi:hypothetical protein